MSHYKIASPEDWTQLSDRPPVEVKVSSRGLLPGDSLKIASEVGEEFIHRVRQIEKDLDKRNLKFAHDISCGSTEFFGHNRNADAWGAEALARDMHTYLKHAKCYRNHKNKKKDPHYGTVKVAMYDKDRGYGRLLVGYYATPEAAQHDKLAKVADIEIGLLEDRGEMRVSHGSKVAYDVCVVCGNQAKTRAEYCESRGNGGNCSLFGCASGLNKMSEDGRVQYVDNPHNIFYDISMIYKGGDAARQADRIAFGSLFDFDALDKTAAIQEDATPGSSWLAEQLGVSPRLDLVDDRGLNYFQKKLLKAAMDLHEYDPWEDGLWDEEIGDSQTLHKLFDRSPSIKQAAVMGLAGSRQFMGPYCFARLAGLNKWAAESVRAISPQILPTIIADDRLTLLLKQSPYCRKQAATHDQAALTLIVDRRLKFDEVLLDRRRKLAAMQPEVPKLQSAPTTEISKTALDYAAAKILFHATYLETQ